MISTVGAALKKIAVALLGEKENWKRLGCIALAVLLLLLAPTMAVQAVFTGADFATEDPAFRQGVVEKLSPETVLEITQMRLTMESLRSEMEKAQVGDQFSKAQLLVMLYLSDKAGDPLFASKLAGCFAKDQTDEQLLQQVNATFGIGLNSTDFTRILSLSSSDLVAVARSQLGNVGGMPYWSWYGFPSRVEWCACFVSWCAYKCGYLQAGILPSFSVCDAGSNWFKARNQWLPNSAVPPAGAIIFFDWEDENGVQDGDPDHVGIVERVENGRVYTIEGNSGDACRENSYPLGYYEIYGYGVYSAKPQQETTQEENAV